MIVRSLCTALTNEVDRINLIWFISINHWTNMAAVMRRRDTNYGKRECARRFWPLIIQVNCMVVRTEQSTVACQTTLCYADVVSVLCVCVDGFLICPQSYLIKTREINVIEETRLQCLQFVTREVREWRCFCFKYCHKMASGAVWRPWRPVCSTFDGNYVERRNM
jgi:hypothetical protein